MVVMKRIKRIARSSLSESSLRRRDLNPKTLVNGFESVLFAVETDADSVRFKHRRKRIPRAVNPAFCILKFFLFVTDARVYIKNYENCSRSFDL